MPGQSNRLDKILMNLYLDADYIYGTDYSNADQGKEIFLREAVTNIYYDDYLARASNEQREIIASIFNVGVTSRYSEILFKPDLKCSFSGRENSLLGRIDAWLGGNFIFLVWLARQLVIETENL